MKKISILFIFSLILGLFVSEVSAAGPRLKQLPSMWYWLLLTD